MVLEVAVGTGIGRAGSISVPYVLNVHDDVDAHPAVLSQSNMPCWFLERALGGCKDAVLTALLGSGMICNNQHCSIYHIGT
jgi:hypothetical protein